MKNIIIGALIVGLAIIVGFSILPSANFGASSGPEHYNMEYFYGGLVYGGDAITLTGSATSAITARQACNSSIISWAVSAGNDTGSTTLPTASALISQCLAKNGDSKTLLFRNTAAVTSTVIVADTGITLLEPDGQNVVIGGVSSALLTFVKASSTGVIVSVDELIDAD